MVGEEIGSYRILEKLGEGGMGAVYKAVDINLDRTVALRSLNLDLTNNPELEQRLRTELKPLGSLYHTNLAALHALLIEQGRPWMVTEFVDGETFDQMIRRRGPIPSEEAIAFFRQALFGIGYGHRKCLVHRDIKPANLILNQDGVVKVMDFGLAKALGARGLAKSGARMGTPAYMSPEQFLNRGVDARSDIYSLGVVLYEMLSGKVPFSADNDYQIMSDHVNTPAPPPRQLFAYIPKSAEQAVLKALEKSPDARYQSVEEFGASLSGSPGPVSATPAIPVPAAATAAQVSAAPTAATFALPKLLATREQRIIAAALVAILLLAGVVAAMRIKASRSTAQQAANAAAQAQNAANNPAVPPPDAATNPQTPADTSQAPPPDASANGVAVVPGAPAAGVAVVPGGAVQQDAGAASDNGSQGATIPAGTMLAIRMVDAVSSAANQVGQTFGASVDADVTVGGNVLVPAGSDATVRLINVAQVPAAERSDVQLQLVTLSINGTDYRTRSSIFEQQSLPKTKKSVAVAGARAAFGALGGVLNHGSAGGGAAAGAASTFVVYIAPQTLIQFKLRKSVALAQ
jgi:Protein kinase domain